MHHQMVSRDEWLAARKQLLLKEKEFTQLRDRLNAERLALPWVKVEKPYVFDGPTARKRSPICSMDAANCRQAFHVRPGMERRLRRLLLRARTTSKAPLCILNTTT